MKTRILYEDEALMIIHKPAGIAVQSARIGQMDVESELRNYLAGRVRIPVDKTGQQPVSVSRKKQAGFLGLVHRLDQPVEGLLVVAKHKEAAARLNKQLTEGSLNKKYLAAVHLEQDGIASEGDFTDYMMKDGQTARIVVAGDVVSDDSKSLKNTNKDRTKVTVGQRVKQDIKKACLHYNILKREGDFALVDIYIETGRFHQIRCQMAYHGMPLLGDVKYGSSTAMERSRKLGIHQVALCANRISFKHPVSGKLLEFQVPPENAAFAKFL